MVSRKMVSEDLGVGAFGDISRGRLLHFDNTLKLHVFRGTEKDWQWHLCFNWICKLFFMQNGAIMFLRINQEIRRQLCDYRNG